MRSLFSEVWTSAVSLGGPVLSTRNSVHRAKPLGDSAQSVGPYPPSAGQSLSLVVAAQAATHIAVAARQHTHSPMDDTPQLRPCL